MIRADGLGVSMATGKLEPFKAQDLKAQGRSSSRAAVSNSFWRMAVLAAAAAIGGASQAEATIYWPQSDGGFSQPAPETVAPARKRKVRQHSEGRSEGRSQQGRRGQQKEIEAHSKDVVAKPHGPLLIAISINKQNMRIYDANGFFAETPISTGMRGHPTPMGVFSVIAKEKLHHSNIYSGAPMPYMQRITWSGIAIHAGVLPGYPASHGCIRMPPAFALKMYGWTTMGARVVITPDEMVPSSFSHPLLVAQKIAPQPLATGEPKADTGPAAKADKASNLVTTKPAASGASLELRSTVGHGDGPKSLAEAMLSPTPLRDQTRTADASVSPTTKSPVTMSDATASGDHLPAREHAVAVKSGGASNAEAESGAAKLEPVKPEAESAAAERTEIASADDKAVDAKSSDAKSSQAASIEINSADTSADKAGNKPDQTAVAMPASEDAAKTEAAARESVKAEATVAEAKADDVKTAATKVNTPKPAAKPEDSVKAATDVTSVADQRKDQGRVPGADRAPGAKPDPPKRTGQIAVFVSRKDSKLYVRQNFAPLFDVPVTIAASDRPLGTHVFTAEVDKRDTNVLRWSVVSLPMPTRNVERRDDDERASRRRKVAAAVEVKALAPEPDSPAEALDRLTIPAAAKARIVEALSTGSSIIVSDQGIAGGETGEGTDFIVSLR
jgi:lipoprotein-anchoring transpeptidase ErfK/SrfK